MDIGERKKEIVAMAHNRRLEAGASQHSSAIAAMMAHAPSAHAISEGASAPPLARAKHWFQRLLRLPRHFYRRAAVYYHLPRDINETRDRIVPLEKQVGILLDHNHQHHTSFEEQERKIAALTAYCERLRQELDIAFEQLRKAPVAAAHAADANQSHQYDHFYYDFERHFRGSEAEVTAKQNAYIPYLHQLKEAQDGAEAILDVGCGRGEWLKLIAAQGLVAKGIDLNVRMVKECQNQGLDVDMVDALSFLRNQTSASLRGITGFHIVEHIPFEELMAIFNEAFRVVKPGGIVIFETPNPENILVGACNFYTDPTHKRPIPPLALSFMLSQAGFKRQDCLRIGASRDFDAPSHPQVAEVVARFYEAPDYAIIGYRELI